MDEGKKGKGGRMRDGLKRLKRCSPLCLSTSHFLLYDVQVYGISLTIFPSVFHLNNKKMLNIILKYKLFSSYGVQV